ncbi:hypothetical protein ACJZ2D_000246 [Fusarium nematophilum]
MSAPQPTGLDRLSSLPDEILLRTFCYLSPIKGGLSLILTSRRFHRTLLIELYREAGRQLGWLPLFFAAKTGNMATLELCREVKAPVDCQWVGDPWLSRQQPLGLPVIKGSRPLRAAVEALQHEAVTWLLRNGADPNLLRVEEEFGHDRGPAEIAIEAGLREVFEDLRGDEGRRALKRNDPLLADTRVLTVFKIFGALVAAGAKIDDKLDDQGTWFFYLPRSLHLLYDAGDD